jgi:hypothetical protein
MKITAGSELATGPASPACAWRRHKSASAKLDSPKAPACKKLRRESGPRQREAESIIS